MNILIIQILRMGDALQLLPLAQGIKQAFPQSRLSILTSTLGASVFANQPGVDTVFMLRKEAIVEGVRGGSREAVLPALRVLEEDLAPVLSTGWDWIINFGYTFSSALLSFILHGEHRSGYSANRNRQFLAKEVWFAHFLASFVHRRYSNFNWVDVNRKVISLPHVPKPPVILPGEEALLRARGFLKRAELDGKRLIGLHPGASGEYKRWPLEQFARLSRDLTNREACGLLIFGGPGERELGRRLKELVGEGIWDLTGETSLEELKAYLSLCELLVTNDTGPMHLAAAVGTRVLGLFFSTHFVETGPYGAGHLVIHPTLPCFPCQGTAACEHRRCLEAVPSEIVTTVIRNTLDDPSLGYPGLANNGGSGVRVLTSRLDPWGYQEWVPVDGSPLDLRDVERAILKLSWLAYTENGKGFDSSSEKDYLRSLLSAYGPPREWGRLTAGLADLTRGLQEQRAMMEKACFSSLEIQSLYLGRQADASGLKTLGQKLDALEQELSLVRSDSAAAFLHELLTVMRENIEHKDTLGLATRTLALYRGMIQFSDLMIKRTMDMTDLLSREACESMLYLGLIPGNYIGWGICSRYLIEEARKLTEVTVIDPLDLGRFQADVLAGTVLHTIGDQHLTKVMEVTGRENCGYTFFENLLPENARENAGLFDLVLAGSTWCVERLKEKGIHWVDTLIQGIDPRVFFPLEGEKPSARDSFVIYSGGKFELRKGQDLVIRAVKAMQDRHRDVLFVNAWYNAWAFTMNTMAASPLIRFEPRKEWTAEFMTKLLRENGLDLTRTEVLPRIPQDQFVKIYACTDIGLFPNRCEGGTNLVLMEYMACGKPVVASFNSGHRDVLTGRNSLPVRTMTPFEFRDEKGDLAALWEEPDLDEVIETLEYAYQHRDRIKELGKQAGRDLQGMTWGHTTRDLLGKIGISIPGEGKGAMQ